MISQLNEDLNDFNNTFHLHERAMPEWLLIKRALKGYGQTRSNKRACQCMSRILKANGYQVSYLSLSELFKKID